MQTSLANLPRRTTGSYLKGFRKQSLKTNMYRIEFSDKTKIVIYSLSIEPNLPFSSNKIHSILETKNNELKESIGNYIFFGRNIFACTQNKGKLKDSPLKFQTTHENQKYVISVKPVSTVDLSNLASNKAEDTLLPLNFLNNLIKKYFASMKYVSIGRSGKYFNPKNKKTLSGAGIILFNGYETQVNITENGLYLRVDSMVRIVQNKTVLDEINTIYKRCSQMSKDQKRNILKEQLIGKTVMANYGNSKIWIIKDIIFDFDYQCRKVGDQFDLNFIQYYEKSYGLTIKNLKQPALKAIMNGFKNKKNGVAPMQFILIPEFMLLSGLPQDFDERKRRQISQYTIIQPQQKLQKIQSLIHSFNSQSENFCPNLVSQNLGIKISPITETVQATILPPPVIQLGHGDSIEKQKVANFQLFNKQIYRHDVPVNIVIIMPNDYDFSPVEKLFSSTCKNLLLKYKLNLLKINFQDSKRAMNEIDRLIKDKSGTLDEYDLNWFILPQTMKSQYKVIKQLSLTSQNPKATQVTLTTTLAKKGFAAILTKILLQISSKVGNVPWAPKVPSSLNAKTMLIGIDVCKDTVNKKFNVVSYCCTLNKDMCKFHSNYHYQEFAINFSVKIRAIIADCLAVYAKTNSFLPQEIVIIKTDLSDGEKDFIINSEVGEIKEAIKQMNGYSPKLTFLTANKNSKQKFFAEGRAIGNPSYGTLINSKIVSKFYDFYLISQHCNRGTVKPIHYKVLYTDSKMQQGILQQLIYSQSFNYMNWSGSIRVPSVLQYATKLSKFISEYISRSPETDKLNDLLYFI